MDADASDNDEEGDYAVIKEREPEIDAMTPAEEENLLSTK